MTRVSKCTDTITEMIKICDSTLSKKIDKNWTFEPTFDLIFDAKVLLTAKKLC
jgi:hypothetical protein